jgi:uncharacterized membrane protein
LGSNSFPSAVAAFAKASVASPWAASAAVCAVAAFAKGSICGARTATAFVTPVFGACAVAQLQQLSRHSLHQSSSSITLGGIGFFHLR